MYAPAAPSPVVVLKARDLLFGGAEVPHRLQQHIPTLNGLPVTQHRLCIDMQRVDGISPIGAASLEVDDDLVHVVSSAGIETFPEGYRLFRCKQLDIGTRRASYIGAWDSNT